MKTKWKQFCFHRESRKSSFIDQIFQKIFIDSKSIEAYQIISIIYPTPVTVDPSHISGGDNELFEVRHDRFEKET